MLHIDTFLRDRYPRFVSRHKRVAKLLARFLGLLFYESRFQQFVAKDKGDVQLASEWYPVVDGVLRRSGLNPYLHHFLAMKDLAEKEQLACLQLRGQAGLTLWIMHDIRCRREMFAGAGMGPWIGNGACCCRR